MLINEVGTLKGRFILWLQLGSVLRFSGSASTEEKLKVRFVVFTRRPVEWSVIIIICEVNISASHQEETDNFRTSQPTSPVQGRLSKVIGC